jgi:hypothetical protein
MKTRGLREATAVALPNRQKGVPKCQLVSMSQTMNPLLLNALLKRLSMSPHKIRAVRSRDELLVAVE